MHPLKWIRVFLATSCLLFVGCGGGGQSVTQPPTPTPPLAPVITSFAATPTTITAGGSTTLTPVYANGTGVITPGNPACSSTTGVTVNPLVTTSYTLTISNSAGVTVAQSCTVTVNEVVPPPILPTISSFTANPISIAPGQGSSLSWSVNGATTLSLDHGIPIGPGTSVSVTPSSSTAYTLTATNAGGSVSATLIVTVTNLSTYIAASGWNSLGTGYWKNKSWVGLTSPPGYSSGNVGSIFVVGNDVYVPGYCLDTNRSNNMVPGYWQNGTWSNLGFAGMATSGLASSIVVSGTDIYAAGQYSLIGNTGPCCYWVNGAMRGIPLPFGAGAGYLAALAVSGNNIYVAGGYTNSVGVVVGGYWLNSTWVECTLPAGSLTTSTKVSSVYISGSDVYVAGVCTSSMNSPIHGGPGYWKNGAWTGLTLPPSLTNWGVASIVVAGNNVYVAGYCLNSSNVSVPGYWLNGTWTTIGSNAAVVSSLTVSGTDVYVGGYSGGNGLYSPGYWLNGVWVELAPPSSPLGTVGPITVQ